MTIEQLQSKILHPGCAEFLRQLNLRFSGRLDKLLESRKRHYNNLLTQVKVEKDDCVRSVPEELRKRQVEITGPASDAKLVINALNSKADVFMADFEDSLSPTWENILNGHNNLMEVMDVMPFTITVDGKEYKLTNKDTILMVRPRGLHMKEAHFFGMPAALFDFGVYFYHNLSSINRKPYFYLPKLESGKEAELWHDVFEFAEQHYFLPKNTIRCTVLIETFPGLMDAENIVVKLKNYIVALNCGRWDYLFSYLKSFPYVQLPGKKLLTMDQPFLQAYSQKIVQTCQKYDIVPIGGMSAFIPVKNDAQKNAEAFEIVTVDKRREFSQGFKGAWVAHPGLIDIVKNVFSQAQSEEVSVNSKISSKKLMYHGHDRMTQEDCVASARVLFEYMAAWFSGVGCVAINNLMEDMATAELARMQIYQYKIFPDELSDILNEESQRLSDKYNHTILARTKRFLYDQLTKHKFDNFLTESAYEVLLELEE